MASENPTTNRSTNPNQEELDFFRGIPPSRRLEHAREMLGEIREEVERTFALGLALATQLRHKDERGDYADSTALRLAEVLVDRAADISQIQRLGRLIEVMAFPPQVRT